MQIYLPENLVLTDIEGYREKYKEKYQWFIHTVIHQSYKNKPEDCYGGYINLQQKILRNYIGERYCKLITEQLEKSGIIKINEEYWPGRYSMSYKLAEKYKEAPIINVDFSGNKASRYKKKHNTYSRKCIGRHLNVPALNQLYKNTIGVEIDADAALNHLNHLLASNEISQGQWNYGKISVESISSKNECFFFKVDENTGRVYNSIVNCPRYLRKYLSYKGQRLMQIDIANSQPMLFSKMLIDYCNTTVGRLNNKYTSDISTVITPYVETSTGLPEDINRYINLCSKGLFYEDLMVRWNIPQSESTRQQFKKTFFGEVFYSKVRVEKQYETAKKFQKIYPTVFDIVSWYKKDNHADLPIQLQRVEAGIVIGEVCTQLVEESKEQEIPFFCTVHDCIVCLEQNCDLIKKLMEHHLIKAIGVKPKVKVSLF